MYHKGLTKGIILQNAIKIIEDTGIKGFTMKLLADTLGVKTASLYKHYDNLDALITEVGLYALNTQHTKMMQAIGRKERDEAVIALAQAYRKFAKKHHALYALIMEIPTSENEILQTAVSMVTEPVVKVLKPFSLEENRMKHLQRVFRAILHGFINQERAGYFTYFTVDIEESYNLAILVFLEGVHSAEKEHLTITGENTLPNADIDEDDE